MAPMVAIDDQAGKATTTVFHAGDVVPLIPGSLGGNARGHGSFAADKVSQQLVHRMFDRRLQRLILDPLNKHVIPKLVRANFPGAKAS